MFSPQVGDENRVMDVDDEKIKDIPDQWKYLEYENVPLVDSHH